MSSHSRVADDSERAASSSKRFLRAAITTAIFVCGFAEQAALGQDGLYSVQALQSAKPRWEQIVNTAIRVEGHVKVAGDRQFRLQKCDLVFITKTVAEARAAADARTVEVSGRIVQNDTTERLEFEVTTVKPGPNDLDRLREKELAIRKPTPEQLYSIAQWADDRGHFYDEAELLAQAAVLRTRGLKVERALLPDGDAAGRLALAVKARKLNVPDRVADELTFDAVVIQSQQAIKALPAPTLALKLIASISELLPGASAQLPEQPPATEPFDDRPASELLATYEAADSAARKVMERQLMLRLRTRVARAGLSADDANAAQVAASLEDLPETAAVRQELQRKHREYRLKGIERQTRPEALALAKDFTDAQQPDPAELTLRRWMTARTERLRGDGAVGLVQAGDETVELLHDQQAAAKLWQEAYTLDRQLPDAAQRLMAAGYHREGERWVAGVLRPAATTAPMPTLKVGMSRSQLRQLMGVPQSITRVFTGTTQTESWIYGGVDQSGLMLQLERSSPRSEPVVTKIVGR